MDYFKKNNELIKTQGLKLMDIIKEAHPKEYNKAREIYEEKLKEMNKSSKLN